jgi:hypothetical protein
MDSIKISDNFTKLEQSIGKINKVYKDNSSYFNVFSISGIKDMFKTIGNLPPKNAIPIILWISIMSIFPIWLALYKFAGTRRTMR